MREIKQSKSIPPSKKAKVGKKGTHFLPDMKNSGISLAIPLIDELNKFWILGKKNDFFRRLSIGMDENSVTIDIFNYIQKNLTGDDFTLATAIINPLNNENINKKVYGNEVDFMSDEQINGIIDGFSNSPQLINQIDQPVSRKDADGFNRYAKEQWLKYYKSENKNKKKKKRKRRFIQGLRQHYPKNQLHRRSFLIGMQRYFGSLNKVIGHYQNIVELSGEFGNLALHKSVAERLTSVRNRLHQKKYLMPKSYVGLGLRGRYFPHQKKGIGLMAHPSGYALDYRAYDNPMLTSKNLKTLVSTFGVNDKENEVIFNANKINVGIKSNSRRKKISKIGNSTKKDKEFLDKLETSFRRIAQTSERFKKSLPKDNIKQLQRLSLNRLKIINSRNEIKKIEKKLKTYFRYIDVTDKNIQNKEEAYLNLLEKKEQTKSNRKKNFYDKKIKKILKSIEKKDEFIIKNEILIESNSQRLEELKKVINSFNYELKIILNPWFDYIEKRKKKIKDNPKMKLEYSKLELLEKALLDEKILFPLSAKLNKDSYTYKKVVKNPSIVQLLDKGFFSPESDDIKIKKNKRGKVVRQEGGFSIFFMRTMAEYGFDQGISWSSSKDAMHLELVDGVNSLKKGSIPKITKKVE